MLEPHKVLPDPVIRFEAVRGFEYLAPSELDVAVTRVSAIDDD